MRADESEMGSKAEMRHRRERTITNAVARNNGHEYRDEE